MKIYSLIQFNSKIGFYKKADFLILSFCFLLSVTPSVSAQNNGTQATDSPSYRQELYLKRSVRYNNATRLLRKFVKGKIGRKERKKSHFIVSGKHFQACKLSKEELDGVIVYQLTPRQKTSDRALVYFHGGGYTDGPFKPQWAMMAEMAKLTGCIVYVVDYALAPGQPFPAGLNDAFAVFQALSKRHGAKNLSLIGDSAGGGMVLSLALKAREIAQNLPEPSLEMPGQLIMISPWLRLDHTHPEEYEIDKYDPLLSPDDTHSGARSYAGNHSLNDPLVSPFYAQLDQLPQMLVMIGTWDILYPHTREFIERAKLDGCNIEAVVAPEMFHVWPCGVNFYPEARTAVRQMADFVLDY